MHPVVLSPQRRQYFESSHHMCTLHAPPQLLSVQTRPSSRPWFTEMLRACFTPLQSAGVPELYKWSFYHPPL